MYVSWLHKFYLTSTPVTTTESTTTEETESAEVTQTKPLVVYLNDFDAIIPELFKEDRI